MYNKSYKNDFEENLRYKIYLENRLRIAKHNTLYYLKQVSFSMSLNKYSDMLHSEFVLTMNGFKRFNDSENSINNLVNKTSLHADEPVAFIEAANVELASGVDWRDKGAVTPIKDQGMCGSCWSFSSTGSLEGQHFRKTGKLVSLSEQNLVDCSGSYGNMGCEGGWMDSSFKYIKYNKEIDTESSYPYEAVDNACRFSKKTIGATDKGFVDLPSRDENALLKAVTTVGPISVAIDANHVSFQFYSKGIYYEPQCSSNDLDHAVLVGKLPVDNIWHLK